MLVQRGQLAYHLSQWFAQIGFGTPAQTLTMFIDTGSADTTMYDSTCATCQLNNHTFFNHTASSTYVATQTSFETSYGDGTELYGKLAQDTVQMAREVKVENQLLALIDRRTGGSDTHGWDGILGIGPNQLSFVEGNVTPFSNMVREGKLAEPLVGVALEKVDKLTGTGGGGEFSWGQINTRYVKGQIVYAPVTSSYFWGVALSEIYVNNKPLMSSSDARRTILDTGTTLIYTSSAAAKEIHAAIPGSFFNSQEGAWYVPCITTASPNVFWEIQGHRWGVPAADIAFRPSGRNDGLCVSGIQGGSSTYTILGDVFIKNHCE